MNSKSLEKLVSLRSQVSDNCIALAKADSHLYNKEFLTIMLADLAKIDSLIHSKLT